MGAERRGTLAEPVDLGGGLVLRRATEADAKPLADFNAATHHALSPGADPDERIRAWTLDLVEGRQPNVTPDDFTVVTEGGEIVSSLCLIEQTWGYQGLPLRVGQIDLVGTTPAHRRRGFVRAQVEVAHRWCQERGLPVQSVAGIPWFYRQFGYEYALAAWAGRELDRAWLRVRAPQESAYRVRKATDADVPFLMRLSERMAERLLVTCRRDAAQWGHELAGRRAASYARREVRVVESASGRHAGLLVHTPPQLDGMVRVVAFELAPGVPWLDATPAVARYLEQVASRRDRDHPGAAPHRIACGLGERHPAYAAAPRLLARRTPELAWYLRVPDLAALVRRLAPAIDRRLEASVAAGVSAELLVSFYSDGLRLVIERGHLARADRWEVPDHLQAHASFPGRTLLQAVFGYRSIPELVATYPDCEVPSERALVLLDACFPKAPSLVWPVG